MGLCGLMSTLFYTIIYWGPTPTNFSMANEYQRNIGKDSTLLISAWACLLEGYATVIGILRKFNVLSLSISPCLSHTHA